MSLVPSVKEWSSLASKDPLSSIVEILSTDVVVEALKLKSKDLKSLFNGLNSGVSMDPVTLG